MTSIQRWTLVVVCAATAILMLDIAVVNTALSQIGDDLDTGLGGLQWVVDAYTLTLATIVLTVGSLADRFGRRRLFALGMTIFTVASLVCAAASSIEMLNVARAVQGAGAALLFATSLALLADAFPDEKQRMSALAAYGATIAGSFAVGPAVGGALTSGLDWRWVFFVNIPIGIACLAITALRVQESRDSNARPVDWPGQATLMSGVSLLVLGLLRGNEDGWGSTRIVAILAAAVVLLTAFVVIERRVRVPMLPMSLFRNQQFTGAQVGAFAISASYYAVFLYTTLYLQQVLGLSAIEAGLVYLPGTLIMFVVSGMTANIMGRVHPGVLVSTGLALAAAGQALALTAGADSSWTAILPGTIIAMIGSGLFNPAVSAVALGSVPPDQSGLAAGVNDTFRQAGIAVGVAALGALIPTESALNGSDPVGYVSGMHDALLAGAGLAAVGAVATAFLIRDRVAQGAPAGAAQAAAA
jgi:EmrB/QacA subfamily drug resistance transporter